MDLQITGIAEGIVIDHIPENKVFTLVDLLQLRNTLTTLILGFNLDSKRLGRKGLIKIANRNLSEEELGAIAIVTPQVTINVIKNYKVIEKINLQISEQIIGILECTNTKCISNHQPIKSKYLKHHDKFKCFYCEKVISEDEICLKAH